MAKLIKNIGFDAKRAFNTIGGLGRYSRSLILALVQSYPEIQFHLYTPNPKIKLNSSWISNYPNVHIHTPAKTSFGWRSKGIISDLLRDNIQIFHGLSNELPWGIDQTSIRTVVTIHDVIFKVYPQYYSYIDRLIYHFKWKHAIRYADHIISISNNTLLDIKHYFLTSLSAVSIIPPIINPESVSKSKQRIQFLFVGTSNERKNLITVLKAIFRMKHRNLNPYLSIVGSLNKESESYIHLHNLVSNVKIYTNVQDYEVLNLLSTSIALVYPSLYEGFGMPVIEALIMDTPVITTRSSGITEAGREFVTYLENPLDDLELADKMTMLLNQKSSINYESLQSHLAQFSTNHIIPQMMNCYLRLINY